MTVGIRIYDEGGELILDETTRTGQFFGSFTTDGSSSGSFTDSSIVGSEAFFFFTPDQTSDYGGPEVSANLSTGLISWDFDIEVEGDYTNSPPSVDVFYGVY